MIVEDNRKRIDLAPRDEIPEAWAASRHCPVCTNTSLQRIHLPGAPDYLLCTRCEVSFEVEKTNGLIRIKNIPDQLGFVEDDLKYNWVQPAVLRRLLEKRSEVMQRKATLLPPTTLDDDEVWSRMLSLYQLGNQPKMIEFMLIQAGATREQTETAALRLKAWKEQDQKKAGQRLLLVGLITTLLLFALFMGGWLFTSSRLQAQLDEGRKHSASANQPNMTLKTLNQIPDAFKPEFLKSPPARVETGGPKQARCPISSQDAAALFGGDDANWKPTSQLDSWQMMSVNKPSTIRLPQGMYAGFIDNTTFVFSDAKGPATIHNVNFIAITCN